MFIFIALGLQRSLLNKCLRDAQRHSSAIYSLIFIINLTARQISPIQTSKSRICTLVLIKWLILSPTLSVKGSKMRTKRSMFSMKSQLKNQRNGPRVSSRAKYSIQSNIIAVSLKQFRFRESCLIQHSTQVGSTD